MVPPTNLQLEVNEELALELKDKIQKLEKENAKTLFSN